MTEQLQDAEWPCAFRFRQGVRFRFFTCVQSREFLEHWAIGDPNLPRAAFLAILLSWGHGVDVSLKVADLPDPMLEGIFVNVLHPA